MKNNRPSLDGFRPRRADHIESASKGSRRELTGNDPETTLHTGVENKKTGTLKKPADDLSLALTAIDSDEAVETGKKRNIRRAKKNKKPLTRRKKIIRWIIAVIVAAVIGVIVYLVVHGLNLAGSVFQGNIFDLVQKQALQQDANGRSNFLVFGTSEDSEDHNANGGEGGPLLTDSIMVLSVNQTTKDAFMVSIPRDLWVKYDEPCSVGYEGKINAVYLCGSNYGENPDAGIEALKAKTSEVTGLSIQYHAKIDYTVVQEAVDAVGGVTVTIESNPAGEGILDRNFDWKCNYTCYYVNYEDGEVVQLDGVHALALARARGASGGYGLAGGNFDREKNQQKIIKALREKALSVGTLTDIGKITSLMNALSNNLTTNIQTKEVQTLADLGATIDSDNIVSISLVDKENPQVTTGNLNGTSIVRPVLGIYDYTGIQAYIQKMLSSNTPIAKEKAPIIVLNGSGESGAAQRVADELGAAGYTILSIGNVSEGTTQGTQLYRGAAAGTFTATQDGLEKYYGATVSTALAPTASIDTSGAAFIVVVGTTAQ